MLNMSRLLPIVLLSFLSRPTDSASFFISEAELGDSWDASDYCTQRGGSLAAILSQADFDDAAALCSGKTCYTGLWLYGYGDGSEWFYRNGAPLTYFGFDEYGPTTGVWPWAPNQPQIDSSAYATCVCLDPTTGFFSCDCESSLAYALCGRAKYEVILNMESVNGGYFSSSFLNNGVENSDDPSANTFSIIGLQGDGEHMRYGDGGDFYFQLTYTTSFPSYGFGGSGGSYGTLRWSQSSWLTETSASGVIMQSPERCGPASLEINNVDGDAHNFGLLGECDGDCDNDDHCSGDFLVCYHRDTGDSPTVPGCIGDTAVSNWDYCYAPCDGSFGGLFRDTASDPLGYLTDGINGVVGAVRGSGADITAPMGLPIFPDTTALAYTLSVYVENSVGDGGHIALTSCSGGWNTDDTTGQVSIMLRGTNGSTPFILVNPFSTGLPSNGQTVIFDIDASELNVGTLGSVAVDVNVPNGFCLSKLSIVSDSTQCRGGEAGACTFGAEYFGRGMVLGSRGSCASSFVSVLSGDDDPLLPCFDEGSLELQANTHRGIVDLSIHSCNLIDGDMAAPSADELKVVLTGKEAIGTTFISSEEVSLSFSEHWSQDTYRRFEVNVEAPLETLTLARLFYAGSDELCVDIVSAGSLTSLFLSNNWLGSVAAASKAEAPTLTAVFKYPVCATEILDVRMDADLSTVDMIGGESTITGLECSNYNRILTSNCAISQSYEMSKTTSFSFAEETSTETSSNHDYSWGKESSQSVSQSEGMEQSQSNEFSFGSSQSLSVGASAGGEIGPVEVEVSVEMSVESNQQWTSTSETSRSQERTSGSEWGTNEAWSVSSGTTSGSSTSSENSWESTTSSEITCEASMDVAPSHSVSYNLVFNAFSTTIRTYTDMKLTLCSALIRGGEATEDDFVYIDNIPGSIEHKETTACEVQFGNAQYLRNEVGCAEEEKLAIAAGATYIPRCQSGDSTKYEPCQCDIGDSLTMGVCWCSDEQGNPSDTKIYQFDSNSEYSSDADVCTHLACSGSAGSKAAAQVELEYDGELKVDGEGEDSEVASESVAWADSVDVELLNNLLMVALVTLVLTSGAIAVCAMFVAAKFWKWISVGKSQSAPPKSMRATEPNCRVELTAIEEEESQETV